MRNLKTVVYGSSYDRGLEHLLKMWPDIIKAVPDAKLRIFYGWNLFDRAYPDNPQMQEWKEKINKLMEQVGITHLGRISHVACELEMQEAGIWAYPTHFGEISCITAMRAQANGTWPVVINYAALKETVKYGKRIDGDIYDEETQDAFKKAIVDVLLRPPSEVERLEMQKWAIDTFGWDKVASQWNEEFKKEKSLESQVNDLMEDNQALKAWDLVKNTPGELRDKVYKIVEHAFNKTKYKDYYEKDLIEPPVVDYLNIDKIYPRFQLIVPKILENKPKSILDLGCADGYLNLTLAKKGIPGVGVNLYGPSVKLANKRAKMENLDCEFIHGDIFDYKSKHDCVVMCEVLEHLPDPQKGVDHVMGLLHKGGSAFFSTPRVDHVGVEQHKAEVGHRRWDEDLSPSGHLRLFTEEEFKSLFKNYTIKDYILDQERCMVAEVTHGNV